MPISPDIIFGLALLVFVLSLLPDQYRPVWIHRLTPGQMLIGLVAVIVAAFIVITPEFYALGLLGDSAFFHLLVLAITYQLRGMGSMVWRHVALALDPIKRFVSWRMYKTGIVLLFIFVDTVSTVQKVAHRLFS
jgi:hypothetical protein